MESQAALQRELQKAKHEAKEAIGKGNRIVFFSNHQIALRSIFKNLVKWQQDFEIQTDVSALLHDNFSFPFSIADEVDELESGDESGIASLYDSIEKYGKRGDGNFDVFLGNRG